MPDVYSQDYYKQFDCARFTKHGSCEYGDDCKYKHADPEENSRETPESVSSKIAETEAK